MLSALSVDVGAILDKYLHNLQVVSRQSNLDGIPNINVGAVLYECAHNFYVASRWSGVESVIIISA